MPAKENEPLSNKVVLGLALQLGFAVSVTAVLFIYGGHWLDQKYDTSPIFFLLSAILGLFASLYLVWQIVRPLQEKAKSGVKELKK